MNRSVLKDDDIEQKDVQNFFKGIQNKPERKRYTVDSTRRSLSAAATTNSPRTILTKEQMLDCATAYIDNGIVRTVIDLLVWFILGEHTKFVIEPNDELLEGLEDEDKRKIEDKIKNSDSYVELRRKILRFNKRVKLHDRLTKFLTLAFIFGRSYIEVKRFTEADEEVEGEPRALKVLTPLRVVDTIVNDDSEFEGILYNFGKRGQEKKKINPEDLIAAWHDDNNVFDNTFYSGASAVWTILSAAQTIETMNDENIPEFVKGIAEGFGFIYTGTNKQSVANQIKTELKHSTIFIHNYEKMRFDKIDIARNPMELTEMLQELAKYIFQCIGAPLFILREDTANFATANQVMQVFKVSKLNRFRTWVKNILEQWYDPILADHLGIELEDVISAEIKVKAVFEDINFETRLDIITADEKLVNLGVYEPIDVAEDIDDQKVVRRLELQNAAIEKDRDESISNELDATRRQEIIAQKEKTRLGLDKPDKQNE